MIAKGFVENGAKVYVVSRKIEACEQVAAALNALGGKGSAVAMAADLKTDAACRDLAAKVAEREEKVDVLVNNAGVTWGDSFENFPEKAWARTMTLSESVRVAGVVVATASSCIIDSPLFLPLDVSSIFHLTRAMVPLLRAASKGNMDPA